MKKLFQNIRTIVEFFSRPLRNEKSDESAQNILKGSHYIVLTQFYEPEPDIFTRKIAETILRDGDRVSVVTAFPNRPGGKLYPGYVQKFGFSEVIGGVKVFRVPLVINHSKRAFERMINFLTFSASTLTLSSKIRRADAVYVYATPATAAIPAQIWKMLFGIPYVLHVQDLWPESVTDSGMVKPGKSLKVVEFFLNAWLKTLYAGADKIIAISPGMKNLLVQRGVNSGKIEVIFNWADESTITPKPAISFSSNATTMLYAGNLGPMQDLETVIKAASVFDSEDKLRLKIAGGGILEQELRLLGEGISCIDFLGQLSRSEVSDMYLESDFQIVPLKDIPIFRVTVPSKLQASLAAGVPVITTVKGDVAKLILEYRAGLVAEPEDVSSLVEVFKRANSMPSEERSKMGQNALKLYQDLMSQDAGTRSIINLLQEVKRTKS